MLGNFSDFLFRLLTFFKINFSIKFFQKLYQGIQMVCWEHSGSVVDCLAGDQGAPGLFDLILYVPSTIFQLNRNGSSWVEPVLS